MDLKNYIEENKVNITQFAKDCHISRYCIYRIINGERRPKPSTIFLIEKKTKGKVKFGNITYERKPRKPKKLDENKDKV